MTIKEIRPAVNPAVVKLARELLAACEAGDVIDFCGVQYERGSNYTVIATATDSKHRMVGALLDAAMARLGYES